MQYVTVDEAYEIASEVAQKTITKFLSNLVRLVPDAEDMVDDIKAEQWRAYRESKSGRPAKKQVRESEDWEDAVEDDDDEDDYMRKVYEEGKKKKLARKSPEDEGEEPEEDEDNTEDVFEQVAHGGKSHVRNMNEIFPDDMEKQITLKDDHLMPSNDPAAN